MHETLTNYYFSLSYLSNDVYAMSQCKGDGKGSPDRNFSTFIQTKTPTFIHSEIIAGHSRYGLQSIAESRTNTGNHTLSDKSTCRLPGKAIHSYRSQSSPP
jgi:hypothetical protein